MNGLGLCAGAGGLEMGLHLADARYRTVGYVERDAYAAAVLVARMEDQALDKAPVWDDLKTFDGRPWRGRVDIVTAGYPCQPFSVAGKRQGTSDPRHLWPDVARVIAEVDPHWVFLENVPNHVNLGLAEVAGDLEGMGYRSKAGLFSAREVGDSQLRLRLFILAHRAGGGRHGLDLPAGPAPEGQGAPDPDGRSPDVARASRRRGREPEHKTRAEPRRNARQKSGRGSGNVDRAPGPRRGAGEPGPGGPLRDQARRAQPDGRGGVVADDTGVGQGQGRAEPAGQQGRPGPAHGGEHLFPPGPSSDAWAGILDADPMASPAVGSFELWSAGRRNLGLPEVGEAVGRRGGLARDLDPAATAAVVAEVHRLAHGLAARVDELRVLGNGVVPVVAAYAYTTLRADFETISARYESAVGGTTDAGAVAA